MKSKAKLRIWTILLTNCLEKYDSNQQFRAHVSPSYSEATQSLPQVEDQPAQFRRARALFGTLLTFLTSSVASVESDNEGRKSIYLDKSVERCL